MPWKLMWKLFLKTYYIHENFSFYGIQCAVYCYLFVLVDGWLSRFFVSWTRLGPGRFSGYSCFSVEFTSNIVLWMWIVSLCMCVHLCIMLFPFAALQGLWLCLPEPNHKPAPMPRIPLWHSGKGRGQGTVGQPQTQQGHSQSSHTPRQPRFTQTR